MPISRCFIFGLMLLARTDYGINAIDAYYHWHCAILGEGVIVKRSISHTGMALVV